jgi:hypothetical protein
LAWHKLCHELLTLKKPDLEIEDDKNELRLILEKLFVFQTDNKIVGE